MLSARGLGGCSGHTCLRASPTQPLSARISSKVHRLLDLKPLRTSISSPSGGTEPTPDAQPQVPTPADLVQLGRAQVDWQAEVDSAIFRQTEWPLKVITAIREFVVEAWKVLPQFTVPTPAQALQKTCLMLGASLLLMVVLSSIDSVLLWLYVVKARILA